MRKATKSTKLWIARDSNGDLYLYNEKPIKTKNTWLPKIHPQSAVYVPSLSRNPELLSFMRLDLDLFPDVKWEDDEPKVVTVKL